MSTEHYRPGYHFTPARNWMNDPNGLVHVDGTYHLFFQHNPHGNHWADMSWGHATSPDLVDWTEQPVALPHGPAEDVYSGCVVADARNTSGFGTPDGPPPLVAVYTSVLLDGRQAQSLASSTDGGASWTKADGNPVLDRGSTAFRDPKVFWYEADDDTGHWVMVVVEARRRQVLIYRSDDLRSWDLLSVVGPPRTDEEHWECPDLFALPVDNDPSRIRWVLVVSVNPGGVAGGSGTRYFIGDFDGTSFVVDAGDDVDPESCRWVDRGRDLYAAVTFSNAPEGRRILLGWMSNWDYAHEVPTHPWRGAMTLPRELGLRTVGDQVLLVQRPVRELAGLVEHDGSFVCGTFDLPGEHTFDGSVRYRLGLAVTDLEETLELDVLRGAEQRTRITYVPETRRLSVDRTASGETDFHPAFASVVSCVLPDRTGRLDLDVWVDRTSVEVFAQDGAASITTLVFGAADATGIRLASGGRGRVAELHYDPLTPAAGPGDGAPR